MLEKKQRVANLQLCVERNLPSAGWIGFKVEGRGALTGYGELVENKRNLQIAMKNI